MHFITSPLRKSAPLVAAASLFFFKTLSTVAATMESVKPVRSDRVRGAILGAISSDALCLGSHYEYDAIKIKGAYGGMIDQLYGPGEKMGGETHGVGWGQRNYHPGKKGGDNTDYGDANVYLLEYLTREYNRDGHVTPFSIDNYVKTYWLKQYEGPDSRASKSWVDSMVKQVLSSLHRGVPLNQAGGMSNGMIVRFAGALAIYETEEDLVRIARVTTAFTNKHNEPVDASEFWARVVFRVMQGAELEDAVKSAAAAVKNAFISEKVSQAIAKVKEATDPNTSLSKQEFADDLALTGMARLWDVGKSEPIKVGKASPCEGTLPGAIYFILKYKSFKSAAQANAMVGGDNASRSIPIGIVLGAYEGMKGIPGNWLEKMTETNHINQLLDTLPLSNATSSKEL